MKYITILVTIVVLEILFLIYGHPTGSLIQYHAKKIVDKCASAQNRQSCYEDEVPKLLPKLSMEDAFRVTAIIQEKDSSYKYCHILGHKLSSKETAKNPDKWKEVIASCPLGVCANGCQHGVVQEKFRTEVLNDSQIKAIIPDLREVCKDRPNQKLTNFEEANCYHGLGHLTMYATGADIKKSLEACDEIFWDTTKTFRHLCYEGLFMQLFQPIEPDDFALIRGLSPSKENLRSFCEQYKDERKVEACWQEGFPLFREEIGTPEGMVSYCNVPLPHQRESCFLMLFHVLGQSKNFEEERVAEFCNQITPERQEKCFSGAASSIIQADYSFTNKAVSLCALAQNSKVSQSCYQSLASFASYNLGVESEAKKRLCDSLPSPWNSKCAQ